MKITYKGIVIKEGKKKPSKAEVTKAPAIKAEKVEEKVEKKIGKYKQKIISDTCLIACIIITRTCRKTSEEVFLLLYLHDISLKVVFRNQGG